MEGLEGAMQVKQGGMFLLSAGFASAVLSFTHLNFIDSEVSVNSSFFLLVWSLYPSETPSLPYLVHLAV